MSHIWGREWETVPMSENLREGLGSRNDNGFDNGFGVGRSPVSSSGGRKAPGITEDRRELRLSWMVGLVAGPTVPEQCHKKHTRSQSRDLLYLLCELSPLTFLWLIPDRHLHIHPSVLPGVRRRLEGYLTWEILRSAVPQSTMSDTFSKTVLGLVPSLS